jgi:hypothetical protein
MLLLELQGRQVRETRMGAYGVVVLAPGFDDDGGRTTRSVSVTEAGARLYERTAQRFEGIDADLLAATERRKKPMGTVRITTAEHAANTILQVK